MENVAEGKEEGYCIAVRWNRRLTDLCLKYPLTAGVVKYLQDSDIAASASALLSFRYGSHWPCCWINLNCCFLCIFRDVKGLVWTGYWYCSLLIYSCLSLRFCVPWGWERWFGVGVRGYKILKCNAALKERVGSSHFAQENILSPSNGSHDLPMSPWLSCNH